jgi:hypothetical protein
MARVQPEGWYLGETGREQVLPALLKDWDPLTDLYFSRTISFDFDKIFSECGLTVGAEILVTASWTSPGTGLKERASVFPFPHGTPRQSVNFAFQVTGSKLAGGVALLTRILLKRRGKHDSPLAASRTGSILWHDTHSMRVEGFGARFPMEFADFSEQGYPPNAGWRLYWKKDFNAQVMGSVCLLINRQHERLRGIVSGAVQDPQSAAILEAMHFSVARELIVGGLDNEDFIEEKEDFPKGSIGEATRLLIKRIFGNEEPEAVRQIYRNDPDRFDCQLQHVLKLFHLPTPAK